MKLRTILAAAPAVALLALVTCAEPPTPTAADPAGFGAEMPSVPLSAGGEQAAMADQFDCRITSEYGAYHLIGPKPGRPHPDSSVAVAEGAEQHSGPNVFWAEGECPAGKMHMEIVWAKGDGGSIPDPEPDDFKIWSGTGYDKHEDSDERQYWLMTYSPIVDLGQGYHVKLELVQYYGTSRIVLGSRIDWAGFGVDTDQYCWVYYFVSHDDPDHAPYEYIVDSEACEIPIKLDLEAPGTV